MNASGIQQASSWFTAQLAASRTADAALAHAFMEHRWGQRKRCDALVWLSTGAGPSATARVRDVSLSGAFLETALHLPLFAQVTIAVLCDDGFTQAVKFNAGVVRSEPGGVGIEWCEPVSGSICRQLGCTLKCAAAPFRQSPAAA